MAAVLDEAMGAAAWMEGHLVVAVRLGTSFQRMLPLGTDALLEAWVEKVEGRKVWTLGRLVDEDGEAFAEADALFLMLDPERFRPLIERVAKAMDVPVEELLKTLPEKSPKE
jgi:acyl-coenzyme A thioesterase PaaI-like protein